MTDYGSSFASFARAYRPWGQVRRKNLMLRLLHVILMTVFGLALLAGFALLAVFAASVAVVGVITLGLIAVLAGLRRTPARIFVRATRRKNAKGVFEAHKKGSTWIVY